MIPNKMVKLNFVSYALMRCENIGENYVVEAISVTCSNSTFLDISNHPALFGSFLHLPTH